MTIKKVKTCNLTKKIFVDFWKNWISKEDFQKYLYIKTKNQIN